MGGEITVGVIGVSVDGPVAGEAMVSMTVVEDAVIGMYVVSMVLVGKADAGMIVISVIGSVHSVVGEAVVYMLSITYNKSRIINDTRVVCMTAVGINVIGEAVVNVALLVRKAVGSNISFCINDSARFGLLCRLPVGLNVASR